ncbi:MAG: rod shape-determining protein MreD [Lachnospiraceae bacterium]|nr:rod shape-determining protein MreD [Lachnospiraceae bacterium]
MLRRVIITAIMMFVCFIAQTSVFGAFSVTSSTPNLMMILTVSFSLMRGDICGMLVGFSAGLLTDIFYSDLIGFYALLYMYAGYLCGRFHKKFYPENLILPLSVITLADFAFGIVSFIALFAVRQRFQVLYYLTGIILPEAVYTLIVAIFLYPLILRVNTWLEDIEQRSARKFV